MMNKGIYIKQIFIFLLLAFLIPLVCIILIMHTMLQRSDVLSLILFGVEAAAPSLAAILTVLHFEVGHGLKKFLKISYANHFNLNIYIIVLFLPVVITGAPKLFDWLVFGVPPTFGLLSSKKILIVSWALIAEELGWRGFLQDRLEIYLNRLTVPLIVGIIWAAWHYHFFISGKMSAPIILFTLGCVADSYVYYAITKAANGNVVPVSVLHFLENLCCNLFLISPERNNGTSVLYLLYIICSLITSAIALSYLLKKRVKT